MTDGYDCYQNALAERVNGILTDELRVVLAHDLAQARLLVQQAVPLYQRRTPPCSPQLPNARPNPSASRSPRRKIRTGVLLFFCQLIAGRDR